MKFILATKQEMTQYFSEDGKCVAATLLSAGPVTVTKLLTKEKDGYEAVQLGFGTQLPKRVAKPQQGALKELGSFKFIREYRPKAGVAKIATRRWYHIRDTSLRRCRIWVCARMGQGRKRDRLGQC